MNFEMKFGRAPADSLPPSSETGAVIFRAEDGLDELSFEVAQLLIDDVSDQVALINDRFEIIAVNRAWTDAMALYGFDSLGPGDNYRAKCAHLAADGYAPAKAALAALEEFASGTRTSWQSTFDGVAPWTDREFQLRFHRITVGAQSLITIVRRDLTELQELRRMKREFAKSVSESHAVERRRLARELHDSTSQRLVGFQLLLGRLKRQLAAHDRQKVVDDLQDLLAEVHQAIRFTSYLAHPPALEEMGFQQALAQFARGFGDRAGIIVSVDVGTDPSSLCFDEEVALYRVVQEALSNVHRHSRARRAVVRVVPRNRVTHVLVMDNGQGIGPDLCPGVGLAGMKSRLSEVGGRLTIRALSPGTAIIASVWATVPEVVSPPLSLCGSR